MTEIPEVGSLWRVKSRGLMAKPWIGGWPIRLKKDTMLKVDELVPALETIDEPSGMRSSHPNDRTLFTAKDDFGAESQFIVVTAMMVDRCIKEAHSGGEEPTKLASKGRYTQSDITKLAQEFVAKMRSMLLREEMAEVIRLNAEDAKAGRENICHSHDFLDSNIVMYDAFVSAFGREPDIGGDTSKRQDDISLWSAAWDQAVKAEFSPEAIGQVVNKPLEGDILGRPNLVQIRTAAEKYPPVGTLWKVTSPVEALTWTKSGLHRCESMPIPVGVTFLVKKRGGIGHDGHPWVSLEYTVGQKRFEVFDSWPKIEAASEQVGDTERVSLEGPTTPTRFKRGDWVVDSYDRLGEVTEVFPDLASVLDDQPDFDAWFAGLGNPPATKEQPWYSVSMPGNGGSTFVAEEQLKAGRKPAGAGAFWRLRRSARLKTAEDKSPRFITRCDKCGERYYYPVHFCIKCLERQERKNRPARSAWLARRGIQKRWRGRGNATPQFEQFWDAMAEFLAPGDIAKNIVASLIIGDVESIDLDFNDAAEYTSIVLGGLDEIMTVADWFRERVERGEGIHAVIQDSVHSDYAAARWVANNVNQMLTLGNVEDAKALPGRVRDAAKALLARFPQINEQGEPLAGEASVRKAGADYKLKGKLRCWGWKHANDFQDIFIPAGERIEIIGTDTLKAGDESDVTNPWFVVLFKHPQYLVTLAADVDNMAEAIGVPKSVLEGVREVLGPLEALGQLGADLKRRAALSSVFVVRERTTGLPHGAGGDIMAVLEAQSKEACYAWIAEEVMGDMEPKPTASDMAEQYDIQSFGVIDANQYSGAIQGEGAALGWLRRRAAPKAVAITDFGRKMEMTRENGERVNIGQYAVWGPMGKGKDEVMEVSDDLGALQAKWGRDLPVVPIGQWHERVDKPLEGEASIGGVLKRWWRRLANGLRNIALERQVKEKYESQEDAGTAKKYTYSITYDVVTPESAEAGDFSESGFARVPKEQETILDIVGDAYTYSISPRGDDAANWWSSEPATDYTTGEYTTYALHVDGLDAATASDMNVLLGGDPLGGKIPPGIGIEESSAPLEGEARARWLARRAARPHAWAGNTEVRKMTGEVEGFTMPAGTAAAIPAGETIEVVDVLNWMAGCVRPGSDIIIWVADDQIQENSTVVTHGEESVGPLEASVKTAASDLKWEVLKREKHDDEDGIRDAEHQESGFGQFSEWAGELIEYYYINPVEEKDLWSSGWCSDWAQDSPIDNAYELYVTQANGDQLTDAQKNEVNVALGGEPVWSEYPGAIEGEGSARARWIRRAELPVADAIYKVVNDFNFGQFSRASRIEDAPPVQVGRDYWFEYHCDETDSSADVHLRNRSRDRVRVLKLIYDGGEEPSEWEVEFSDGFVASVFDDELLESEDQYQRKEDVIDRGGPIYPKERAPSQPDQEPSSAIGGTASIRALWRARWIRRAELPDFDAIYEVVNDFNAYEEYTSNKFRLVKGDAVRVLRLDELGTVILMFHDVDDPDGEKRLSASDSEFMRNTRMVGKESLVNEPLASSTSGMRRLALRELYTNLEKVLRAWRDGRPRERDAWLTDGQNISYRKSLFLSGSPEDFILMISNAIPEQALVSGINTILQEHARGYRIWAWGDHYFLIGPTVRWTRGMSTRDILEKGWVLTNARNPRFEGGALANEDVLSLAADWYANRDEESAGRRREHDEAAREVRDVFALIMPVLESVRDGGGTPAQQQAAIELSARIGSRQPMPADAARVVLERSDADIGWDTFIRSEAYNLFKDLVVEDIGESLEPEAGSRSRWINRTAILSWNHDEVDAALHNSVMIKFSDTAGIPYADLPEPVLDIWLDLMASDVKDQWHNSGRMVDPLAIAEEWFDDDKLPQLLEVWIESVNDAELTFQVPIPQALLDAAKGSELWKPELEQRVIAFNAGLKVEDLDEPLEGEASARGAWRSRRAINDQESGVPQPLYPLWPREIGNLTHGGVYVLSKDIDRVYTDHYTSSGRRVEAFPDPVPAGTEVEIVSLTPHGYVVMRIVGMDRRLRGSLATVHTNHLQDSVAFGGGPQLGALEGEGATSMLKWIERRAARDLTAKPEAVPA